MSGKWFDVVSYKVRPDDQLIDMDEVATLARSHKPKMIVAGGSAYSRHWDFARFREIADEVGAFFMVDMAHFAGLSRGGAHPRPSPCPCRRRRRRTRRFVAACGGMVLTDDEDIAKKVNSAVFPGLQGGPLMHVIAAKAVAFGEALRPDFKVYAHAVVENARALADTVRSGGWVPSSRAAPTITSCSSTSAQEADRQGRGALGRAHMTCNKNGVPFDPEKPMVTSGIRLGTPAATSRGLAPASSAASASSSSKPSTAWRGTET